MAAKGPFHDFTQPCSSRLGRRVACRRVWPWLVTSTTVAQAQSANKVFELRTYTAPDGKLPELNARFRNHTMRIFRSHGMTNVGYWVPQDAPPKDNTLIYIISHDSREAAKKNWADFAADPEWKKVSAESQVNGRIVRTSSRCSWTHRLLADQVGEGTCESWLHDLHYARGPADALGRCSAAAGAGADDPRFTGISTVLDAKDLSAARRRFEPGARSAWHSHDNGQLLFVEKGRGRTQKRGRP